MHSKLPPIKNPLAALNLKIRFVCDFSIEPNVIYVRDGVRLREEES